MTAIQFPKVSRALVFEACLVLLLALLPLGLIRLGLFWDYSEQAIGALPALSLHLSLDWSALILAMLVLALAANHYWMRRDRLILLLGLSLGGGELLRLVVAVSENQSTHAFGFIANSIPLAWTASQLFLVCALITAVLLREDRQPQNGRSFLVSLFFFLLLFVGIAAGTQIFSSRLDATGDLSSGQLAFFHGLNWLTLALFLLIIFFVFLHLWRTRTNRFVRALWLGLLPFAVAQAYITLGSSALHDSYFYAAHTVKLLGYIWPLIGLLQHYADTFAAEQKLVRQLQQEAERNRLLHKEQALFFDTSLDLLCIAGFDGYFKQLNPKWQETLGYSEEELLARPFVDFVHPKDREATIAEAARLASGDGQYKTVRFENRYRHADGTYRDFLWTSSAIPDSERLMAVARDVTDFKAATRALRESENLLQSVLQNSLDSIAAYRAVRDDSGQLVDFECLLANRQAAALANASPEALQGSRWTDAAPFRHRKDLYFAFVHVVEKGEPFVADIIDIDNGSARWLKTSTVKLGDGFSVTYRDFTVEKQLIFEQQAALDALKESEQRYRDLYNRTPVMLHSIDNRGRLLSVSDYWLKSLGYTRAEVLGRRSTEFLTKASQEKAKAILAEYFRVGYCVDIPYQMVKKNGEVIDILLSATAERDSTGEIVRSLAVITDVTEQKKAFDALQKSERSLAESQRLASIGNWAVNMARDEWFWSEEMYRIHGIQPTAPLGVAYLSSLIHPDDFPNVRKQLNLIALENPKLTYIHRIVRPDGTVRWVQQRVSVEFDSDDNQIRRFGTCQDITEQKEMEAVLARHVDELARSNQDLEQFAYIASHDLREPLRKVQSFAELLARRYQERLDERGNLYISHIVDGAQRMQMLIRDVLDYSRVGRDHIQREWVDMNQLVRLALINLDAEIQASGVEIQVEPLPTVYAVRSQMAQLVQNLVENAIKFRRTCTPRVCVSGQEDNTGWTFQVEDNGIGIEDAYASRVFDMFGRLHSKEQYAGSGIGLALCKKIVEYHGGTLEFDSRVGQGTKFYFTIPAL